MDEVAVLIFDRFVDWPPQFAGLSLSPSHSYWHWYSVKFDLLLSRLTHSLVHGPFHLSYLSAYLLI